MKGDQWGFLPGPGVGAEGVTSVRATVFLMISAGGGVWRAAPDIAATKLAAGCAEGGQGAQDTPRPAEGGRTARPLGNRSRGRPSALAKKFWKKFFSKLLRVLPSYRISPPELIRKWRRSCFAPSHARSPVKNAAFIQRNGWFINEVMDLLDDVPGEPLDG